MRAIKGYPVIRTHGEYYGSSYAEFHIPRNELFIQKGGRNATERCGSCLTLQLYRYMKTRYVRDIYWVASSKIYRYIHSARINEILISEREILKIRNPTSNFQDSIKYNTTRFFRVLLVIFTIQLSSKKIYFAKIAKLEIDKLLLQLKVCINEKSLH